MGALPESEARSRALRALAEVPGGAAVVAVLQRWPTDAQPASCAANIKGLLETISADGETLDAHLQDALHIALTAQITEVPRLRRALCAVAVMRALNTQSDLGREWDPVVRRDEAVAIVEAVTTLSDPIAELEATILELRQAGLVVTREAEDTPAELPWEAVGPYHFFFCRTDALFQHWDPAEDAKELCRLAQQTRVVNSAELDTALGWGPRRLNSAVAYAQRQCWISTPYRRVCDDRYVLPRAYLTQEGSRSGKK